MKKVTFALLFVFVLCLSSFAEINTSTESEREEHLNIALSNMNRLMSDVDVLILQSSLNNTRQNFLRLYSELWQKSLLPEKLTKAVNESVNARTKKMLWGTKSLQLGLNAGKVINKIQQNVASKIAGDYNIFLGELESEFIIELHNELETYHSRISSLVIASSNNPIVRAYLRKNLHIESDDMNLNLKADNHDDISEFQKDFASYINKYVERAEIYRSFTSGAAGKIIGENIPVVGQLLLAWSIYDIASMAWKAESDIRKILHERNQSIYSSELALVYWDVIEGHVIDSFIERYTKIYETRQKAFEFANAPYILERYAGMNEIERIKFADELMNQ